MYPTNLSTSIITSRQDIIIGQSQKALPASISGNFLLLRFVGVTSGDRYKLEIRRAKNTLENPIERFFVFADSTNLLVDKALPATAYSANKTYYLGLENVTSRVSFINQASFPATGSINTYYFDEEKSLHYKWDTSLDTPAYVQVDYNFEKAQAEFTIAPEFVGSSIDPIIQDLTSDLTFSGTAIGSSNKILDENSLVTVVNSSSTDLQIPTAQATYNAIQTLIDQGDVIYGADLTALNALATKDAGKLYGTEDTNLLYRWDSSQFVLLSDFSVTDSGTINLTKTDQNITADVNNGSITNAKLSTGVNASLSLANGSLQATNGLADLPNAGVGRANLGLTIGADVQAWSSVLQNTTASFTFAQETKLAGIEPLAEANNISDVNATDLTDGTDSTLHFHVSDRNRANHTGTQLASTISDFDLRSIIIKNTYFDTLYDPFFNEIKVMDVNGGAPIIWLDARNIPTANESIYDETIIRDLICQDCQITQSAGYTNDLIQEKLVNGVLSKYIDIESSTNKSLTTNIFSDLHEGTICAWINWKVGGARNVIYSNQLGSGGTPSTIYTRLVRFGAGALSCGTDTNSSAVQEFTASTGAITDGLFYFVVGVKDPVNNNVRIYLNSGSNFNLITSTPATFTRYTPQTTYLIGTGSSLELYNLRVFGHAKTTAQIQNIFNSEKSRFGL